MLSLVIRRRSALLLAACTVLALASFVVALQPSVAWATPPQDRAHQTAPVGTGNLCSVGPSGGTCSSPTGDLTVTIPAGALSQTFNLQITQATGNVTHQAAGCDTNLGHDYVVQLLDSSSNPVNPSLSPAAQVSIKNSTDDVRAAGGESGNLRIGVINSNSQAQELATTDNAGAQTVTASISSFGTLALFAKTPCLLPVTGASSADTLPWVGILLAVLMAGGFGYRLLKRSRATG